MEQRIDALEKRLARFRGGKGPEEDDEVAPQPPAQPPVINQEISSKILAFQSEIRRLEQVCFRQLLVGRWVHSSLNLNEGVGSLGFGVIHSVGSTHWETDMSPR
jgi:hypothetical protein